jgi:serine/threonine protein kinase
LGPFLVRQYVGQGDLGLVYRATAPAIGSVAVKVLFGLSSTESLHAFRELMPRLAHFNHPNVTRVVDHGEHAGVPYLVVEHLAGGSLADRGPEDPIGGAAALGILRGIASAVDLAHAAGFVHGALTTRQVLLDVDGRPVVTDLGIAGLRWSHRDGTTVGGSPDGAASTAPEVVAGGAPSAAADRYAFAIIAYELLTGQTPFQGDAHADVNARLDAEPVAPSSLRSGLDPAIDAVLLRGLATEPAARWQTCMQMVEALSAALSREAVSATAAPERARRRRVWPWRVAGVGLLFVVIAGVAFWFASLQGSIGITLSSSGVLAGDQVTVGADHLPANQLGTVELQSGRVQLSTFQADQYGNMQSQVRVPQDTSPGDHLISLCWNGSCPASAWLTVTERPPNPTPTSPPPPTPMPTPTE